MSLLSTLFDWGCTADAALSAFSFWGTMCTGSYQCTYYSLCIIVILCCTQETCIWVTKHSAMWCIVSSASAAVPYYNSTDCTTTWQWRSIVLTRQLGPGFLPHPATWCVAMLLWSRWTHRLSITSQQYPSVHPALECCAVLCISVTNNKC